MRASQGRVQAGCAQSGSLGPHGPLGWFEKMIPNCLEYVRAHKASGRPVVGLLCEYTPREVLLAAGAAPVILCGGSVSTIPAAENDLPANLCPLIKSTYGYHLLKSNPFLEMADLVVAETTCDGKKKMYELMGKTRPMFILELPQKEDDAAGLARWTEELRRLRADLESRFGVAIADDKLREAIRLMNRERAYRRALFELMKAHAPPLTGRQLLECKSSVACVPGSFEQFEKTLCYYRAQPPCEKMAGRVRVLLTGVPIAHGAERVLDILEGRGGLVVAMENCSGLKPIMEDVDESADDPLAAIAEKYYHLPCSVMTRNQRRMDLLLRLAREYRAECVIELIWQACITYDVESYWVKRLAEEELSIPYLRIETDYSPADSARIAVRVEALFETVRGAGR